MDYEIGTKVLGGWEIVRQIGEGSYGKVYQVRKSDFGVETVSALKVIRIPSSQAEIRSALSDGMDEQSVTTYFKGFVDDILHEIAIMSTLKSHPNIVSCEDHQLIAYPNEIRWDILIRMELLTPLTEYQRANGFPPSEVIRLGRELSEALAFCEKKSIIHRDIKPENIFVNEMGQFKLGDFGVAKATVSRSTAGSRKGTERYMAPEVYLNQPYGPTVDLYSLGLVMYRLLNGYRLPFLPSAPKPIGFADYDNALIKRIQGTPIPPPPQADEALSAIILKACAFHSKDRWRSAGELLAALNRYAGISESAPPPPAGGFSGDVPPAGDTPGFGTVGGTMGGWGTRGGDSAQVSGEYSFKFSAGDRKDSSVPPSSNSPGTTGGFSAADGGTVGGWGTREERTAQASSEYSVKFSSGDRRESSIPPTSSRTASGGAPPSGDALDDFLKQRSAPPPKKQSSAAGISRVEVQLLWEKYLPKAATKQVPNYYFQPNIPADLLSTALAGFAENSRPAPQRVIGLLTDALPPKTRGLFRMGNKAKSWILVLDDQIALFSSVHSIGFLYRDIKDAKVVEDPAYGTHKLKILLKSGQILLFSPSGTSYKEVFQFDPLRDALLLLRDKYSGK